MSDTFLRQARKAAGLSVAQVADRSGYSASGVRALENGQNTLHLEAAKVFAPIVKRSAIWLMTGNENGEVSTRTVPLVGFVGAGDAAHFYATADDPNETVDAPDWASEETRAAEIRGASLGPLLEGWLVYFDKERPGVPPEFFGRVCVVGLPDDRVLVKRVRPARGPGFFHLESNNEPTMFDEEVVWSAVVKEMRPR